VVSPADPWREREPCRSAGRLYALGIAVFAPAVQIPDVSLSPDFVLDGEVFEVGEGLDRRLDDDPVDVGFGKTVVFGLSQ
jgi:hypothetical protein